MVTPIPTELIFEILRFSTAQDVLNWMSLGSVFLQCAMEARYRTVTFSKFNPREAIVKRRLRDPFVARYVQRVVVQNPYMADADDAREAAFELAHTASKLTEIATLEIDWIEHAYSNDVTSRTLPTTSKLIRALVIASGTNLRHFYAKAHWAGMSLVKELHSSTLTQISLRLYNTSRVENQAVAVDAVACLLAASQGSLKELSLSFAFKRNNIATVYEQFSVISFAQLHAINIEMPFMPTALPDHGVALSQFLCKHAPLLRTVSLSPVLEMVADWMRFAPIPDKPSPFYAKVLQANSTILRCLHRLRLTVPSDAHISNFQGRKDSTLCTLAHYFTASADTLTGLSLAGRYLSYRDLERILDVLDETLCYGCKQLQKLSLCIEALTPRTIDLLASRLPCLIDLHIELECLACEWYDYTVRMAEKLGGTIPRLQHHLLSNKGDMAKKMSDVSQRFISHMSQRTYGYWKLQHISTFYSGEQWVGASSEPLAAYARSAICAAVPNVHRSWETTHL